MGRRQEETLEDFYIYELNFESIPAQESKTLSFNIQADSDFRLEKTTYFSIDNASLNAVVSDSDRDIPLLTMLVTDTGSGRQLMDAEVSLSNFFGTGQIPFIWQQPKTFSARSTISVTINNFGTVIDYRCNLSFIGSKIFNI